MKKQIKKGALTIAGVGLAVLSLSAFNNLTSNAIAISPMLSNEESSSSNDVFFNGTENNLKNSEGNLVYEIREVGSTQILYAFDTSKKSSEEHEISTKEIFNSDEGFNKNIFGSNLNDYYKDMEIKGFNFKQDETNNTAILSLMDDNNETHIIQIKLNVETLSGTIKEFDYTSNVEIKTNNIIQFKNSDDELFTLIFEVNDSKTKVTVFDKDLNIVVFGGEDQQVSELEINNEVTKITAIENSKISLSFSSELVIGDMIFESEKNIFEESDYFSQFIVETTNGKNIVSLNFDFDKKEINSLMVKKIDDNIEIKIIDDSLFITNGERTFEFFKDESAEQLVIENFFNSNDSKFMFYLSGSDSIISSNSSFEDVENEFVLEGVSYKEVEITSLPEDEELISTFAFGNGFYTLTNVEDTYKINEIDTKNEENLTISQFEDPKLSGEFDEEINVTDIKTNSNNDILFKANSETNIWHYNSETGSESNVEAGIEKGILLFDINFIENDNSIKTGKENVFGSNIKLEFVDYDKELYNSLKDDSKVATLKLINSDKNELIQSKNIIESSIKNEGNITEVKFSFDGNDLGSHKIGGFSFDSIQLNYGNEPLIMETIGNSKNLSINDLSDSYKLSTNGLAIISTSFTVLFLIIILLLLLITINIKKNKKLKAARSSLDSSINDNIEKNEAEEISKEEIKKDIEVKEETKSVEKIEEANKTEEKKTTKKSSKNTKK